MVAKRIYQSARVHVPLQAGLVASGAGAVMGRSAVGESALLLPTAATTYSLVIPLSAAAPFEAIVAAGGDPFGFRVESIALYYVIGAVNLTAHTMTVNQEVMAGGAARAAATTFGGTLSYTNNGAVVGSLPVAFSANANLTLVTLGTPAYLNADNTLVQAEWTLATGAATGTATVYGIMLNGTYSIIV